MKKKVKQTIEKQAKIKRMQFDKRLVKLNNAFFDLVKLLNLELPLLGYDEKRVSQYTRGLVKGWGDLLGEKFIKFVREDELTKIESDVWERIIRYLSAKQNKENGNA